MTSNRMGEGQAKARQVAITSRQLIGLAVVGIVLFGLSLVVSRRPTPPVNIVQQIGFEQKLNGQIPLALAFNDESGRAIHLDDYFGNKPAILMMGYYKCPNLCDLVRQGLATTMQNIPFQVGRDYNVIAVSIDPTETPDDAMNELMMFEQTAGTPPMVAGVHFLTGSQDSIDALASAIGFKYAYDPATKQYAHPSGIVVLTPQGRLSRYFYGISYPPADVRLGLVEASKNTIGSLTDYLLLTCYHYDPLTGGYSFYVLGALQLGGMLTLGVLIMALVGLSLRRKWEGHGY